MICSVNPYIGYAIELKVRAKHVRIAKVPTKDVPGYLEKKWAVLTMQEYFILSMAGRNDVSFVPYFKENGLVQLLETKSLPKRPMPFDVTLFSQAELKCKLTSHRAFWDYKDKSRAGKADSLKIRTTNLKGSYYVLTPQDARVYLSNSLSRSSDVDVIVSIRNSTSTGESNINQNRGKSRGSDPVWMGGEHNSFLPITPGLLKRRFLKKEEKQNEE